MPVSVEGGWHARPGVEPRMRFLGASTLDVSANEMMWELFARHPRPAPESPERREPGSAQARAPDLPMRPAWSGPPPGRNRTRGSPTRCERDRGVHFHMSKSTKIGLAWGAVLLLIQTLLAGVIAPGLGKLAEQGRRAASEAVMGGVGLIVMGLAVIAVVVAMHHHTRHHASRR